MPLYVYEVVLPDGTGGEQFEVLQKMSDDALTKHPETGEPSITQAEIARWPLGSGFTLGAL